MPARCQLNFLVIFARTIDGEVNGVSLQLLMGPMHIARITRFSASFFLIGRFILKKVTDTHKSFTRYKYGLEKISCTPECTDEYFKYHIDVARACYFLPRVPHTEN